MANISHTDDEYNGGASSGDHDSPERPHENHAAARDTEESDGYAALDGHGTRGIEEFGDKEELKTLVSSNFVQFRMGEVSMQTLVPFEISAGARFLAS